MKRMISRKNSETPNLLIGHDLRSSEFPRNSETPKPWRATDWQAQPLRRTTKRQGLQPPRSRFAWLPVHPAAANDESTAPTAVYRRVAYNREAEVSRRTRGECRSHPRSAVAESVTCSRPVPKPFGNSGMGFVSSRRCILTPFSSWALVSTQTADGRFLHAPLTRPSLRADLSHKGRGVWFASRRSEGETSLSACGSGSPRCGGVRGSGCPGRFVDTNVLVGVG